MMTITKTLNALISVTYIKSEQRLLLQTISGFLIINYYCYTPRTVARDLRVQSEELSLLIT